MILHMDHCQKNSWQLFDVFMWVYWAKKCLMDTKHFYPWITSGGHKCFNTRIDALPSLGVNPLEGPPKCNCGKLGLGRHS